MAGTNDILEEVRSAADIVDDLKRLHRACHERSTASIALSVPDFWREEPHAQRKVWLEVNEQLRQWASTDSQTYFIDTAQLLPYNKYKKADGAWDPDGIHFSEKGSLLFGAALAQELLPLLPSVSAAGIEMSSLDQGNTPNTAECNELMARPGLAISSYKRILVLGSSTALQHGDTSGGGTWTNQFAACMNSKGFEVVNAAIADSTTSTWQAWLCEAEESYFESFSIVLMALSPADEGLNWDGASEAFEEEVQNYNDSLQMITFLLRGKLQEGARLVLGGPHPNDSCRETNYEAFTQVLQTIFDFDDVDYVIDFLHPIVHDGSGHWIDGLALDANVPNQRGHDAMFQCVDIVRVLGNRPQE